MTCWKSLNCKIAPMALNPSIYTSLIHCINRVFQHSSSQKSVVISMQSDRGQNRWTIASNDWTIVSLCHCVIESTCRITDSLGHRINIASYHRIIGNLIVLLCHWVIEWIIVQLDRPVVWSTHSISSHLAIGPWHWVIQSYSWTVQSYNKSTTPSNHCVIWLDHSHHIAWHAVSLYRVI